MAKQSLLFYCLSFIALILLQCGQTLGQHTTSPRFSPNPQPTSSGVYCIQMVCPSASKENAPSCPTECPSGCKYVPDQCCPQITVAVCQVEGTSLPSSSGLGASATRTTSAPGTPSTHSSSSSPSATIQPNTGIQVHPSIYSSMVIVIVICSVFIHV